MASVPRRASRHAGARLQPTAHTRKRTSKHTHTTPHDSTISQCRLQQRRPMRVGDSYCPSATPAKHLRVGPTRQVLLTRATGMGVTLSGACRCPTMAPGGENRQSLPYKAGDAHRSSPADAATSYMRRKRVDDCVSLGRLVCGPNLPAEAGSRSPTGLFRSDSSLATAPTNIFTSQSSS